MCLENSKVSLSLNFNRLRACDWFVWRNFFWKAEFGGWESVRVALPGSGASGLLSFRGLAESVTLCLKQWTEGQVTI